MKLILLAIFVLIACVVMFFIGLFSPRRSRGIQKRADSALRKGEAKTDRRAGLIGDVTSDSLDKSRRAVDASAKKGRDIHERIAGE